MFCQVDALAIDLAEEMSHEKQCWQGAREGQMKGTGLLSSSGKQKTPAETLGPFVVKVLSGFEFL